MDFAIKLTIVASVVLIGYSLSQLLSSYETLCKKVDDFKRLAAESDSKNYQIKRSNFMLVATLSLIYVGLIYFSGFDYPVLCVVGLKLFVTMSLSNSEIDLILRTGSINHKFFMIGKLDSLVNMLLGAGISMILVL